MSVFDLPADRYTPALSQDDVENWDSLAHVTLILSLESAFGVQFDPEEAQTLTSVKLIRLTLEERGVLSDGARGKVTP